jgi:hypothetical protein
LTSAQVLNPDAGRIAQRSGSLPTFDERLARVERIAEALDKKVGLAGEAFALVGKNVGDIYAKLNELRLVACQQYGWAMLFAQKEADTHADNPLFPAPLPPGFPVGGLIAVAVQEEHDPAPQPQAAAPRVGKVASPHDMLVRENQILRQELDLRSETIGKVVKALEAEIADLKGKLAAKAKPAPKKSKPKPKKPPVG